MLLMSRWRLVLTGLLIIMSSSVFAEDSELHWLKNASLEAGFSVDKGIRLEVLRERGGDNFLRSADAPTRGVKTWIMTPAEDLKLRDLVSECPGMVESGYSDDLILKASCENVLGLELEWRVRLNPEKPVLEIVHVLHHHGNLPLHVAAWGLIAVGPGTVLEVPFSRSPNVPITFPNDIAVFPFTTLPDGRISSDKEALRLDIREGTEDGNIKLGLVQRNGLLLIKRGGRVLESRVAYDPAADYPEGGSNITLYASPADSPSPMGEGEHVGPLRILKPGESLELRQTLRVLP